MGISENVALDSTLIDELLYPFSQSPNTPLRWQVGEAQLLGRNLRVLFF
jgi:hypothetical protein